jgi:hypothetical protein
MNTDLLREERVGKIKRRIIKWRKARIKINLIVLYFLILINFYIILMFNGFSSYNANDANIYNQEFDALL